MFKEFTLALSDIVYPKVCPCCDSSLSLQEHDICFKCRVSLPFTDFHTYDNNPVAQAFWGKIPIEATTALLHFQKAGMVQSLLHELKYRRKKDIGIFLGKQLAYQLSEHPVFQTVDKVIPVPLHPKKQRKRGYNQSSIIAQGFCSIHRAKLSENVLIRNHFTATQTKKNRWQRWNNVDGRFLLKYPKLINEKHILLIDDVVTTGSTLEACAKVLLTAQNVRISIATVAFAEL